MKKRGMKKRILAALMTACMVVGAVPGMALADVANETAKPEDSLKPSENWYTFTGDKTTNEQDAKIRLSKTAVYNSDSNDYTITLKASAEETVKMNPTEVMFLLDASGSMNACEENIVDDEKPHMLPPKGHHHYFTKFTDEYRCSKVERKETNSRWKIATDAIKTMTENLGTDGISYQYAYFNDNTSFSKEEKLYEEAGRPSGGTKLIKGIETAIDQLNKKDNSNKVLIVVADGDSDDGYTSEKLDTFKQNSNNKVFTVGFAFKNNDFDAIASQDCNFNAKNANELTVAFDGIRENISGLIDDPLGNNVILSDSRMTTIPVKGDNGHVYQNATVADNKVIWKDSKGLTPDSAIITYRVTINGVPEKAGEVALNGNAKLNYSYNGETHSIPFPTPSVTGAKLTVNYVDDATKNTVKTDTDWVGLTGGTVSFKKITKIPETITVDGTTYYVISSDPETIPTPTKGEEYKIKVVVSKEKPNQNIYQVIYDANGGSWDQTYTPDAKYTLNENRTEITRNGMAYGDLMEILGGENAPKRDGYTFKGWKLGDDLLYVSTPVGRAADANHSVVLKAVWEKNGSAPAESVTYEVNKHYIDTDENDSVYNESVDVGQTAEEGSLIENVISGYKKNQPYGGAEYLYDHATVKVDGVTEACTDESKFQKGKNIIDLYYYRDSWKKGNNDEKSSETGGDGIADIKQVLVKFGNKDGNGTVTDKGTATNDGTVQVYTLKAGEKNVTPSLNGVTVTPANGYEFKKWTKNNYDDAGVNPDIAWSVKGGDTIHFWAWFDKKEPEEPEIPDEPVATDLISTIVVECKNAEASGHQAKAYTVSDHDSYEIGDVELADGKYQSKIKIRGYYYAKLYNNDVDFDHAVTVNDVYYNLTWDEQAGKWIAPAATSIDTVKVDCTGSEPVIPETPKKPAATDLPSVVVQCVNENRTHQQVSEAYPISHEFTIGDVTEKDGTFVSEVTVHGWYYADKFNAESGVKHPVTVNDVTFEMTWNKETKKWTAPAATSIDSIEVDCSGSEKPEDPELPSYNELKDLIGKVVLVHTGSNAEHKDAEYDLVEGSYEITRSGNEKAVVTVNADDYVTAYNKENGTHTVQGKSSVKLTLVSGGSSWELAEETLPVQFTVKCTGKTPEEPEKEKPDLPKYDDLKKLFGESITVTCTTDADHEDQKFGLMADSYSVTRDNEDNNAAVVTVRSAKYIKAFNDGKHTNAGDDAARVNLIYDDGTWYAADEEIVISFKAKCEKKASEKQFTDIKFVVVNGTFTENGKTEITKSFAVGTKLTLADIPESKGMSKGYSDQTWDKYPLGYTVGEEGTTFTITYRWKSSGSDSGSDDSDDSSVSTRKYATDASGKHGRWILEGGEFTEDNGRLPSNEYLKIGDTIYGFYTYGFAIDFDRPEYYTDEAIQAKGGYRDATGTWRLNGWWFCYDDGTFPHNEWKYLTWNGRSDWYYFDVDGWMEDGWLFQNNNWYYLHTKYDNTRGHMYTGWHEIDGKWYYFNTAADKGTLGALLTNTTTPDGFQVDANGAWIR